ncbi:hypothetical protein K449DRAFT_387646 [Hypoxylon sp. EC38]|nr:hypothetical protein K449DRAFT_387646 [Hypoxylon sp. EC38]
MQTCLFQSYIFYLQQHLLSRFPPRLLDIPDPQRAEESVRSGLFHNNHNHTHTTTSTTNNNNNKKSYLVPAHRLEVERETQRRLERAIWYIRLEKAENRKGGKDKSESLAAG